MNGRFFPRFSDVAGLSLDSTDFTRELAVEKHEVENRFRKHIDNAVWRPIWDVVFSGSSALLAIFLGAALGNVVRGVPLDASGGFFLPLWTSFEPGPNPGILDWYTVLVGAYAYLAMAMHGTQYLYLKTEGVLHRRAALLARRAWYFVAALTVPVTLISFRIQPHIQESFAAFPAGYAFPVLACIGLAGVYIYLNREDELKAFLASCFYLLAMLASVVCGLLPLVLPATSPQYSLTVTNASAAESGLRIGLFWFFPGAGLSGELFDRAFIDCRRRCCRTESHHRCRAGSQHSHHLFILTGLRRLTNLRFRPCTSLQVWPDINSTADFSCAGPGLSEVVRVVSM